MNEVEAEIHAELAFLRRHSSEEAWVLLDAWASQLIAAHALKEESVMLAGLVNRAITASGNGHTRRPW